MFRNGVLAGIVIIITLAGCASQGGSSSQVASTDSAAKCQIDVKRVCQEARNLPVTDTMTGTTQDRAGMQQNFARTATLVVNKTIPNGSIISIECEVNTEHNSVVYAHLMPGPPLTPTDVSYLETSGYCAH